MDADDPMVQYPDCDSRIMSSDQGNISVPAQIQFQTLGKNIQISYGNARTHSREPRIIILFGWMDAPRRTLAKYATNHRLRWTSSDIVVVQSHPAYIWMTDKQRRHISFPPFMVHVRTS
ncbi:hypothetical protein K438DRAFT_334498 [Mycena galopus ATCC 62051]|nr:hypothetical protein K438DRAFT_334498 [Mycena galopus ATCC 62051]